MPPETTIRKISSDIKVTKIMEEALLNDADIATIMRRKLGTNDFRIENWSLDRLTETNGFLGRYYELRVTCDYDDLQGAKFAFFAKGKPPPESTQNELAVSGNVFRREITFYEELAIKMGMGEGPKWRVDCFLGKDETLIVLEDAKLEGFAMPDKYAAFDRRECLSMLRTIGKLHARSMILDEKLRRESGKNIGEIYGDILQEGLFPSDDRTLRSLIGSSVFGACSLIDLIDFLDDRAKLCAKNLIADWSWRLPRLLETSTKYRNVICHRDPWSNNMLMRRRVIDNAPETDFYLIDFQFVRYSPPAIDFMLSLYLTTRRDLRDAHFEEFAKDYHEGLREELRRENLDIDQCDLSWNTFRESCDHYRPLGIIYATVNQQIILMDPAMADKYFEKSPELLENVFYGNRRQDIVCPMFATSREYRERITENIVEVIERLSGL